MIAIVGRPNVGKSTLFNRLLGRRTTVVSPTPGTTRDRVYGRLEWRGHSLTLIDTGGFDLSPRDELSAAIQAHVRRALQEADGVLFLCDAQQGLVPMDELVMDALRKTGKPVILAANKADQRLAVPPDLFALGLSPVFPISALHGRGVGELLDYLTDRLAASPPAPLSHASDASRGTMARPAAVAIVGRPNVGKSSLLNALLREERVIVSEMPGTTRDAIDTPLMFDGVPVTLIDTAGLRHRRKVKSPVELFAMSRALEAIDRCNVALAVLDATQGVTQDDRRLLTKIIAKGCGLVLLLNKWDLVSGPRRSSSGARLREDVRRALPFAAFAPVLAVSATSGFQVERSLRTALSVVRAMRQGLPERALLGTLQQAWEALPPPRSRGRILRFKQARWVAGPPCRVVITISPAARLPLPFQRALLKRLQAHPTLTGVPLVLDVQGASGVVR